MVWCLAAGVSALRVARERAPDPMPVLQAEFEVFAPYLPARGDIGYLEQREGGDEAVRTYYAAQYALVPRVILSRVGPEFLIVPRGAAQEDDERLQGFHELKIFASGHRLFRRLP